MTPRIAIGALLALVSLALHLGLVWELDRLGVLAQSNVLLGADLDTRLESISGGKHLGIKHPNLMATFTPPIALTAKVASRFCASCGSEAELRRSLGVVVVPLASALWVGLVFALFLALAYSTVQATVAAVLALVSFSSLIFLTVPESYGLTGFALALAYLLAARWGGELTPRRTLAWIVVGVFATGITITNVILVGALLWAVAWEPGPRWLASTLRVAALVAVMFGVTGVTSYILDRWIMPSRPNPAAAAAAALPGAAAAPSSYEWRALSVYFVADPARQLARFPTVVTNSFAPPAVHTSPIVGEARYRFGFTLETTPSVFGLADPLGSSLLLFLVAGTVCSLADRRTRRIAVASVGILLVNWLLSTWGSETALYSQHWLLAALVLLAGVMRAPALGSLMTAVLGVTSAAMAINNALLLDAMLRLLRSAAS